MAEMGVCGKEESACVACVMRTEMGAAGRREREGESKKAKNYGSFKLLIIGVLQNFK